MKRENSSYLDSKYSIPNSFKELLDQSIDFYQNHLKPLKKSNAYERRQKLTKHIENFHKDCGTLNREIKKGLKKIRNKDCLFLMTAHQPNLFAYSGVFRKATLIFILGREIEKLLGVPVVNFFGIADQDFAGDRWVKSSLLPAVDRKGGTLSLRFITPEKKMTNKVTKPSIEVVRRWGEEIKKWLRTVDNQVKKFYRSNKLSMWYQKKDTLQNNFVEFWEIVEEAYDQSTNYADFNGFIMSKIVNDEWGYDTMFSRFSECQQIFSQEFEFLLSNFNCYSESLTEANRLMIEEEGKAGVSEEEPELAPFWYHCECGSKVKLSVIEHNNSLIGHGPCIDCNKEYEIHLGTFGEPDVSSFSSKISARAIPMTLVFFKGLHVSCYVGGVGGYQYLMEAKYVAKKLKIPFPIVAFWRPYDRYLGIGQLATILEFNRITGTDDVTNLDKEMGKLQKQIKKVYKKINELEVEKEEIVEKIRRGEGKKKLQEKLRNISVTQSNIKKSSNLTVLNRNQKILENVSITLNMFPSIIDYAINIGLPETSKQWINFLVTDGSFSSEVQLNSILEDLNIPFSFSG